MVLPHEYYDGKHNHSVCMLIAGQIEGSYPPLLDQVQFARNYEQGYSMCQGAWTARNLLGEPGKTGTDDMDMDCETVKEQTTDTAQRTKSDEDENENASRLETLGDDTSTHWPMADPSWLTEQGTVKSSTEAQESRESELGYSDEMEICNTDTDSVAHNTGDTDANTTTDSIVHKSVESIKHNTTETSVTGSESSRQEAEFTESDLFAKLLSGPKARETSIPPKKEEIPTEEPEIASTGPEYDSDFTEEPLESSTSTERETGHWKFSEEESDTTEVETNPVEWLNNKNFKLRPFNFPALPDNVRQQILGIVLISKEKIRPYYNFGSLELPAQDATRENYALVVIAFAGNKELVNEATTILYGKNVFHLRHARVSLWWLKRIGSNISKVRQLVVTLEEGVLDNFTTRAENIWRHIFYFLHDNHKLSFLGVIFSHWTLKTTPEDGLSAKNSNHVWEPRYSILRTLFKFRGLKTAVIHSGTFVTKHCAEELERALVLAPGETDEEIIEIEKDIQPLEREKYSFA